MFNTKFLEYPVKYSDSCRAEFIILNLKIRRLPYSREQDYLSAQKKNS